MQINILLINYNWIMRNEGHRTRACLSEGGHCGLRHCGIKLFFIYDIYAVSRHHIARRYAVFHPLTVMHALPFILALRSHTGYAKQNTVIYKGQ